MELACGPQVSVNNKVFNMHIWQPLSVAPDELPLSQQGSSRISL